MFKPIIIGVVVCLMLIGVGQRGAKKNVSLCDAESAQEGTFIFDAQAGNANNGVVTLSNGGCSISVFTQIDVKGIHGKATAIKSTNGSYELQSWNPVDDIEWVRVNRIVPKGGHTYGQDDKGAWFRVNSADLAQ
jgi:hypothetical protein